jgi:hypothetical protein
VKIAKGNYFLLVAFTAAKVVKGKNTTFKDLPESGQNWGHYCLL